MSTGTVKFYNEAKGFGFIVDDESQDEIFVHATGLVDQIGQNDKVTYDVKDGKKGFSMGRKSTLRFNHQQVKFELDPPILDTKIKILHHHHQCIQVSMHF